MTLTIADKMTDCTVMEKKKAQAKYDDAIAAGKQATLMKESESNPNLYDIDIGNILPGQEAVVELKLLQPLSVSGKSY